MSCRADFVGLASAFSVSSTVCRYSVAALPSVGSFIEELAPNRWPEILDSSFPEFCEVYRFLMRFGKGEACFWAELCRLSL